MGPSPSHTLPTTTATAEPAPNRGAENKRCSMTFVDSKDRHRRPQRDDVRLLDHQLPRALKRLEQALDRFRAEVPAPGGEVAAELAAAQLGLRTVIEAREALRRGGAA